MDRSFVGVRTLGGSTCILVHLESGTQHTNEDWSGVHVLHVVVLPLVGEPRMTIQCVMQQNSRSFLNELHECECTVPPVVPFSVLRQCSNTEGHVFSGQHAGTGVY